LGFRLKSLLLSGAKFNWRSTHGTPELQNVLVSKLEQLYRWMGLNKAGRIFHHG